MAAGDITKLPTAGIKLDTEIASVSGNGTTMYYGTATGHVRSMTSAGVMAELTTKVKVPGRIVAVCYTSSALAIVTADGKVWTCGTDGSSLTMLVNLNMGVSGAYYYSSFLYVFLANVQQEKSSLLKIATA
jgi:hypothetical protein